jgi:uncharacterized membrane protein
MIAAFRSGPIGKDRLEAFTDGVVAIVITLLALELRVPEGLHGDAGIWKALAQTVPAAVAWVVSFLFVLVLWVNHHFFFASLRHADRGLLWLNGLFLLCVTATPFPTALAGAYPGSTPPLFLLSVSMGATSLTFSIMRFYASFVSKLTREYLTTSDLKRAMAMSAIAPALYALSAFMAFVWKPGSLILLALVPTLFFLRSAALPPIEA